MEMTDYIINIGNQDDPIMAVVEKYMLDQDGISEVEFQKAKRLLNSFKRVLWTISSNVKELDDECRATMNEELAYAIEILDKFDYRMDTCKLEGKLVANQETRLMADIKYDIVEEIGVLSENAKGWRKEINLISWNGGEPK